MLCMCAGCMYSTVLDVCMYAEKTKKYTLLNSYGVTGCCGVFYVYRPLDFLALL